jgi:hypothetical protein
MAAVNTSAAEAAEARTAASRGEGERGAAAQRAMREALASALAAAQRSEVEVRRLQRRFVCAQEKLARYAEVAARAEELAARAEAARHADEAARRAEAAQRVEEARAEAARAEEARAEEARAEEARAEEARCADDAAEAAADNLNEYAMRDLPAAMRVLRLYIDEVPDPRRLKAEEVRRLQQAYRKLVLRMHPDKGGDAVAFQQFQAAYDTWKSVLAMYM